MPDSDRMDLLKERYSPEPDIAELLTSDARIDLHIHTCYSDGELTPQQVVDRWQDEGYKIIAITDHDGMQGSVIGMDYSADKDIIPLWLASFYQIFVFFSGNILYV